MANRLIHETSPYLLQHANNPVDWYAWSDEALQKAKEENKPMLVSIGYAACHWCHVMEKESFEDSETAAIMNRHFVNIKIDREERPDLDHIYMDAVQVMTGSGGWPLNVFLTPDAKPFYGGTYFPPKRAFNRPSWREVLLAVSGAFAEKRNDIDSQAANLTAHLLQSNSFSAQGSHTEHNIFSRDKVAELFHALMASADKERGGFGSAPKFPQSFSIQFLLRYYYLTHNEESLKQACLTLDRMIEGGIYDQIGGGFARYSTDDDWLVPHFEKMLYDNALLVSVLSEAYQATQNQRYSEAIEETIEFVQRELMHPEGGFYSALDADSEGEEGKFYVWEYNEVRKVLGSDFDLFAEFFDIGEAGNLPEGQSKTILRVKKPAGQFAAEKGISPDDLKNTIRKGSAILLAERSKRIRPALDDKVILAWNALMNIACCKAFAATGRQKYRELALENMQFLLDHFWNKNENYFYHTWKNNHAKNFAFLDDYAFLIQAMLRLQEVCEGLEWLQRAREITDYVMANFSAEDGRFFYFTDARQHDVIFRKKEIYDGATPSGNATMAYNIYQLSIILDIPAWRQRSEGMLASLNQAIFRYPASFGVWAQLYMEMTAGTDEIVVAGEDPDSLAKQVLAEYIPHKVLLISSIGNENLPMLAGKLPKRLSLVYLCRGLSCLKPVPAVRDLLELLQIGTKMD